MACIPVNLPGGGKAIVCTRGPASKPKTCCVCNGPATRECDHKGLVRSCGRGLCDAHTHRQGEIDFCPAHAPTRFEAPAPPVPKPTSTKTSAPAPRPMKQLGLFDPPPAPPPRRH